MGGMAAQIAPDRGDHRLVICVMCPSSSDLSAVLLLQVGLGCVQSVPPPRKEKKKKCLHILSSPHWYVFAHSKGDCVAIVSRAGVRKVLAESSFE